MDFNDTPQEAEFRAKCRAWLEANAELKTKKTNKNIKLILCHITTLGSFSFNG